MSETNPTLWNQVLRFLSFRPRSEFEIKTYLAKKEASSEDIEIIVAKLKNYKFIDDTGFTRRWVESRIKTGKGRNYIYHELQQKGIDKQLAKETLADFSESEAEAVSQLAEKLLAKYQNMPTFEAKNKLLSAIVRRGYSYDDVRSAVEKAFKKE